MSIDAENPLLIEILTGSPTSYTYNPSTQVTDYPHTVGKSTLLISGLQARNNARVMFVGSLDFFSNDFFESSVHPSSGNLFAKSGNEDLATGLTQWLFKERGVIRVAHVDHHQVGEKKAPAAYTIKQQMAYSIKIEEMVAGKWEAFKATDVQLEFIMLDPYVRTGLKSGSSGRFETEFTIPDVYGVFKLNVDYQRIGYTHLFSSTQVSVRPLEHTQYERFIPAAFPYYASSAAMIAGVIMFSFIQLYHQD
jgi:oligosaccharyltransferase complex subunit beta